MISEKWVPRAPPAQRTTFENENVVALRYLIEVVDAGSFSQAARRLGLNPSTLTRRVARIEDELGLTLFERTRSGIRTTLAGKPVVDQIRRAVAELMAVVDAARANGVGRDGEIRVGTRMPLTAGPLLEILSAWRQVHPGILLRLFEMNDDELRSAIAERRVEAAFVVGHALWPGSTHCHVLRERIWAAFPTGHFLAEAGAVTWKTLRSERLLTQGWNDSQTAREFFASLLGSGTDFVSHGTSKQSIFALVSAGYGITLAVESQSILAWPGVVFRQVCEPDAYVDVSLVWLPQREDAAAGLFVAFVRDHGLAVSASPASERLAREIESPV